MTPTIRLSVIATHPVQYMAPWFRYIAANCPQIGLTVIYATRPTPAQQGVGFGVPFEWDIPLTEGYRSQIVRSVRPGDDVHSGHFWGLHVPEIAEAIRASRPDVALIFGWHSITLARALWTCKRMGIPVLYRGDTHLGCAPTGWRRSLWEAKTRFLLHRFDAYLSVGRRTRDYFRHFGVNDSKIFDSPHCVDNAFFESQARQHLAKQERKAARESFGVAIESFVVLFVGKIEPKKNPLDLIRAVARLGPKASLLMVGTGPQEEVCRKEAERLNLRVFGTGFLNQTEIAPAYAATDCLALPSNETWGLVVNEALSTGLPCVVSDRAGCGPDLITTGETGETFRVGDVDDFSAALERIRQKIADGHDFAPACRERISHFSYEQATAGLLAACHAAVSQEQLQAAKKEQSLPRIIACCGGMVVVGGMERITFEVLRVLQERGSAVHCIVNSWENHRIVALAEEIGVSWSVGRYLQPFDRHTRNPIKLAKLARDILMTSLGLLKDACQFRPTHIFIPEFMTCMRNAPALLLLRCLGVTVIMKLPNAPDPGPFYRRVWRWVVNPFVDHFVCNSNFNKTELLAHGISEQKVSRIYNTVPYRKEAVTDGIQRDPSKVIYVGQIIPEKGVDLLLDAIGMLVAKGYDPRLDIAGEMNGWVAPAYAGYREKLIERASKPDLVGRIRFLGRRDDVPALLSGAGIHCCPSRPKQREAFGLVCAEAKMAGIPSVVFPSGALPELITHERDGWICPSFNAVALAEGIEYFLTNPELRAGAGLAALASMERFSRHRFAEAWVAVFSPSKKVDPLLAQSTFK